MVVHQFRDAALPSKLESASKFIVGKTRPYLPASVTPALDKVEQSPMAFIATLLVNSAAIFPLFVCSVGLSESDAIFADALFAFFSDKFLVCLYNIKTKRRASCREAQPSMCPS